MMARSSDSGSRDDTGCGVAPTIQHATVWTKNATPFGSAIVTKSPSATPAAR